MSSSGSALGLWIHGSSGRMGQEIQRSLAEPGGARFRLIGGSAERFEGETFHQGQPVTKALLGTCLSRDEIALAVDFSTDAGNALLLEAVESGSKMAGKALLIGTTGLDQARLGRWREVTAAKGLRTLIAPNTSIGVLVATRAALETAKVLSQLGFDIEITETHHRHKKDAPSGTARFMAETLAAGIPTLHPVYDRDGARKNGEIGVHAVRGGAVFGEHDIRMIGEAEEVSISHRAFSRALFATGALVLGAWLCQQAPGLYGLLDVDLHGVSRPTA